VERDEIRQILRSVSEGGLEVEAALDRLRLLPLEKLGFATVDLHRAVRRGFPEVIFGPGKNVEEIVGIARRMAEARQTVLVTRVGPEVHAALLGVDSRAVYHERARAVTVACGPSRAPKPGITLFTAGTSDRGVAEEAIVTAEAMGNEVRRAFDVGVAGVHRLLEHHETLLESNVVVVVAGMEGALPSVVAGMTDCPVIGVPTSTGYGVGAKGEAALLAMLNSCAAGLTVVNIDNGFGAGYAAALINRNNQKTGKKTSRA
jgi:NCAIR mutase (PurE)-related protein